MKQIFIVCCVSAAITLIPVDVSAQNETFDLITYNAPKGWKKEVKNNVIVYSKIDNKTKKWCQIGVYRSTTSKGSIDDDLQNEWNELAVKQFSIKEAMQASETHDAEGWKIKTGSGKFIFNNQPAAVLLTTFSGYDRCISILATTNSQVYLETIENFAGSIVLKKPEAVGNTTIAAKPATGFAFTTTNFDDGWTSTVQDDWVQATKGTIKVLIHYPNKTADAYNSVLLDGLKNAWNVLVAPRYNAATNFEFKPITGWQSIEFAEADAVEKEANKTVHVVLFKMNYSNGSGKYLEFITPDKNSFEQEFGAYHQTTSGWEKMENIAYYNKFAVTASDLKGKWTSNFSGAIQYVNAYTGFDAGMDTHASNENYEFADNTYKWDLGVASGRVGNIKFQGVKSSGKFSMKDNWHVYLSDIENKPRTYDAWFTCIKGLRILWIDNRPFAKKE